MADRHTAGPWRYLKERHGTRAITQFIIDSSTRKLMFVSEVWDMNHDPKWRKAHPEAMREYLETMREVEANVALAAASPVLLQIVKDCEVYIQRAVKGKTSAKANAEEMLKALRAALKLAKPQRKRKS